MASIGVVFPASASRHQLAPFAERMEAFGYDELWIAAEERAPATLADAARALAASQRIKIGIGPLWATTLEPLAVASEAAELAWNHPGRLTVSVGAAPRGTRVATHARTAALDEVVIAVRMLLAGQVVNGAGTIVTCLADALDQPPDEPPSILIESATRAGLGSAARRADGLVLPEGSAPGFISYARAVTGSAPIHGARPIDLAARVWLVMGESDAAGRAVAALLAYWARAGLYPEVRSPGRPDQPASVGPAARGLIDQIAIQGSATRCAAAVDRFLDAGLDRLLLSAADRDTGQYVQFAQEVLPLFNTTAS